MGFGNMVVEGIWVKNQEHIGLKVGQGRCNQGGAGVEEGGTGWDVLASVALGTLGTSSPVLAWK